MVRTAKQAIVTKAAAIVRQEAKARSNVVFSLATVHMGALVGIILQNVTKNVDIACPILINVI
jgi:hypothetical protein